MKVVSVIFTEHEENGRSNSTELLTILNRVNPEVIFVEVPASTLAAQINQIWKGLEANAVSRYREQHHADLIPVDLPTPDAAFFEKHRELLVSIPSPEFDQLASWHRNQVRAHGLTYLNSDNCSSLFAKQHGAILRGIGRLADRRRLTENYESWLEALKRRDVAMIENIRKHCRQGSFNNAAFLVGAGHRQSIMGLSRCDTGPDTSKIQWTFPGIIEAPNT